MIRQDLHTTFRVTDFCYTYWAGGRQLDIAKGVDPYKKCMYLYTLWGPSTLSCAC